MSESLHFTVEGEFITNISREKLFLEKDLGSALRILRSSLVSDELSSDEQLMLCLQILNGDAAIKGNSGDGSYHVEIRDDIEEKPTDIESIAQLIADMAAEIKTLKKENSDMAYKISYLASQTSDFKLQQINTDYYNETGEPMFSNMAVPSWAMQENQLGSRGDMLESFLAQRRREDKAEKQGEEPVCDYGWLEPDGTWHPVEWGRHSEWAGEWLKENKPYKVYPEIYVRTDEGGSRHHISNGDVLIFSLGWVLIDSPWQGLPKTTSDPGRKLTKAQKEFLYDYFIERGRNEEANRLYEE